MKRTGLNFYVEGEFVREGDWQGCDDPADEEAIKELLHELLDTCEEAAN